jgi:hypothetical protein
MSVRPILNPRFSQAGHLQETIIAFSLPHDTVVGMTRTVTPLQVYFSQRGLFSRVAKKLGIDPSYVSRVANGHRSNDEIEKAIETELKKIRSSKPARRSSKAKNNK